MIKILKEYKVWWLERKNLFGKDWEGKENRLFVQERGKPINPDTINFWLKKFISNVYVNSAIKEYTRIVDSANKTLSTLMKIITSVKGNKINNIPDPLMEILNRENKH